MQALSSTPRQGARRSFLIIALVTALTGAAQSRADVITDWDARATSGAPAAGLGQREVAIVDLAMFDAVNSITHRYRGYLASEPVAGAASAEAAAAAAAARALGGLRPQSAGEYATSLREYLGTLGAPREAIERGVHVGEAAAQRILDARANDGATGTDNYRPHTQPGKYVPTATMVAATWPAMHPFVLERADQYRPGPPVALDSAEWAADYNEIKSLGARDSKERSAQQTESAKFWLMTGPQAYQPLARELVSARNLSLTDSARFMALFAVALTDAYIAVFDAKYHYEFWRPITAIRNGDIDGNPDTEIDPNWQPLDATPLHPEYPCAHCILSGAAAAVFESLGGGELPTFTLSSVTAPGVTHRWSTLEAFASEVANARIWAGFHYRSSTRVGTAMGREVGRYVAQHFAQPQTAGRNPKP